MDYGKSEKVTPKRNKMIEPLREIKNDPDGPFDIIYFLPGDNEDEVNIQVSKFRNPGEKIGGNQIGDAYEVVLFKDNIEEDVLDNIDRFEAIFSEPCEYISNLILQNWFGMVVRKTTNSGKFVQNVFDKLNEV